MSFKRNVLTSWYFSLKVLLILKFIKRIKKFIKGVKKFIKEVKKFIKWVKKFIKKMI